MKIYALRQNGDLIEKTNNSVPRLYVKEGLARNARANIALRQRRAALERCIYSPNNRGRIESRADRAMWCSTEVGSLQTYIDSIDIVQFDTDEGVVI